MTLISILICMKTGKGSDSETYTLSACCDNVTYCATKGELPTRIWIMTVIFDVHVTVHRDKFLITKPTRCTNFSNVFLE